MRVGIDASNLRRGGGQTHLLELIGAAEPERYGITKVIVWSGKGLLSELPSQPWLEIIHEPLLDKSLPFRLYWQQVVLPRLARKTCDLVFAPGGMGNPSFSPFVTMFRNMIPFDDALLGRMGWSLQQLRWRLVRGLQLRSFREAEGVIFLNEFARSAVVRALGEKEIPSVIIPHGVNFRFQMLPRPQHAIAEYDEVHPFRLLYVSIIFDYKHHREVVEAVSSLRMTGIPVCLDLIGGVGDSRVYEALKETMAKEDPAGSWCNYLGNVPFGKLHASYQNADLFIYASSCENLPNILLEAMAAGLPIACSDRGPMPEVLGESGVYFDPENPAEIAQSIVELLERPAQRAALAQAAYDRAAAHSWDKCADQTFAFLSQIARRKGIIPARTKTVTEQHV